MTIKVVYNARHGGFSISQSCALYMAERGNEEAQKMLDEFLDPDAPEDWEATWYGNWEGARHDPLLVKAVEHLGAWASADCASLAWVTIEGDRYIISEYDGYESVTTPEDIKWIEVVK